MTSGGLPSRDLRSAAAIGDGCGGFVIDETLVRAPVAGEVRVTLRAAGICHTDHASLHWPDQPVLLNWAIPCGLCPQCERGRGSLCERTHGVDLTDLGQTMDDTLTGRGAAAALSRLRRGRHRYASGDKRMSFKHPRPASTVPTVGFF
jgi:Zn-dependent alcohol dehydrogenase